MHSAGQDCCDRQDADRVGHAPQVEGCGLPRQLLSAAAAATPLEDLEKAARAEQGHARALHRRGALGRPAQVRPRHGCVVTPSSWRCRAVIC